MSRAGPPRLDIIYFTTWRGECYLMAKWRDTAWKDILCDIPQSAVEYLMPDLAAKMDPAAEIRGIRGMEQIGRAHV